MHKKSKKRSNAKGSAKSYPMQNKNLENDTINTDTAEALESTDTGLVQSDTDNGEVENIKGSEQKGEEEKFLEASDSVDQVTSTHQDPPEEQLQDTVAEAEEEEARVVDTMNEENPVDEENAMNEENTVEKLENEVEENIDDEDDDDFGSFDEASIENLKIDHQSDVFHQDVFQDIHLLNSRLDKIVEELLPQSSSSPLMAQPHLLNENATERFSKLSEAPRLNPPSWFKSKMRSNLLQNLGLPTDLEEVESNPMLSYRFSNNSSRAKSITEHDIDWSAIELPPLDSLTISDESKAEFINNPTSVLNALEEDPVKDFSPQALANCSGEMLDQKLKSLTEYHSKLVQLCAVGKENIEELRRSQAVFESVVENLVGYNQKVQRNELLGKLSRSKTKRGKKTF